MEFRAVNVTDMNLIPVQRKDVVQQGDRCQLVTNGIWYVLGSDSRTWTREPQDIGTPFVSVASFGINPSNTDATNDAIFSETISVLPRGSHVHIPAGIYRTATGWTLPDGMQLTGDHGARIEVTAREVNALTLGHDCTVEGLEIVGDGLTGALVDSTNIGITAVGKRNVTVRNCRISKCEVAGISCRQCSNVIVTGNTIFACPFGTWISCSDILVMSSGSFGQRTIITDNLCLSNNSHGIFVNGNGYDRETVIANNVCVALDPSTCVDGGTWEEAADAILVRRHGIIVGYVAGTDGPRVVIANNICRNTEKTGIYLPSDGSGVGAIVTGNICSHTGVAGFHGTIDQDLKAGILVGIPGCIVSNNVVTDFRSQGTTAAAIKTVAAAALITNNRVEHSLSNGIEVDVATSFLVHPETRMSSIVRGNWIEDCARYAIVSTVYGTGDASQTGGHTIEDNEIRTNGTSGLAFFQDAACLADGIIRRNRIVRTAPGPDEALNAGVFINGALGYQYRIVDNWIEGWQHGITAYGYVPNARNMSWAVERNHFTNCVVGVGYVATSYTVGVVPVIDCTFDSVTNPIGGNTLLGPTGCGYLCSREGDVLILHAAAAAPTIGTWAVGDRADFGAPVAGGYIGAVCVTAGNPGTWKGYGSIEP